MFLQKAVYDYSENNSECTLNYVDSDTVTVKINTHFVSFLNKNLIRYKMY